MAIRAPSVCRNVSWLLWCLLLATGPLGGPLPAVAWAGQGQGTTPPAQREPNAKPQGCEPSPDPFADLGAADAARQPPPPPPPPWHRRVFGNLLFRKEVASQVGTTTWTQAAGRHSVGFEIQRKFSSRTATRAAVDVQGRLVRRDGSVPVANDMEGADRPGWSFEYHNLYVDMYDVFHPLLSENQQQRFVGRLNVRAGRFYVPFGLNTQTDTHGTIFQLSNERNFGFERDWYSGLWGNLNRHLDYGVYYLLGSGYDLTFKGQRGLVVGRLSLANRFLSQYGWEGGLSVMTGERLTSGATMSLEPMGTSIEDGNPSAAGPGQIQTRRIGIDARYRRPGPGGSLTATAELSGGRDWGDRVVSQLYQAEYLRASRRWGLTAQYWRLRHAPLGANASVAGEAAWYFRNDVGSSNLHWIRFNVERQLERVAGRGRTIVTLQYYLYL